MALEKPSRGRLTERRIRDAGPGPKTVILWDETLKGFGVRVTPAGAKAYIINYRTGGRERRATLARCAEITLKAARERAGAELAAIRNDEDRPAGAPARGERGAHRQRWAGSIFRRVRA